MKDQLEEIEQQQKVKVKVVVESDGTEESEEQESPQEDSGAEGDSESDIVVRVKEKKDAEQTKSNGAAAGESGSEQKDDEKASEKPSVSAPGAGRHQKPSDEEIRSFTDDAYRKNESNLFSKDNDVYVYGNVPKMDTKNIMDYKEMLKKLSKDMFVSDKNVFAEYRRESAKVVSYLVKEFELRKNADMMKKVSVAKTGDLNMNRIFSYQFSEDIFKKISVMPDGKSHGLILFLDWSGSMERQMADTVKQLLTLVLFCKSVQIPFEVYAFTNFYYTTDRWKTEFMDIKYKDGDIKMEKMNLLNLFSSKMSMAEMNYIGNALLDEIFRGYTATSRQYYQEQQRWDYKKYENFTLGGTPLNECIVAAMDIIPKFQKRNKLQVVNTVFLTDGDGSFNSKIKYKSGDVSVGWNLVVRDPITKVSMRADGRNNNAKPYLHILKQRTGCNIIGFRLVTNREARDYIERGIRFGTITGGSVTMENFNKDKSVVCKADGFDENYLLKSTALEIEEDELEIKSTTTRGYVSAFKKYTKSGIQNKVILNRFISLIS